MNDVRPFFGEEAEVLSAPKPTPTVDERYGTYEERRQWLLAENRCPMPACHEPLEEGACPRCGWSVLEEKLRKPTVEDRPDYLPTLPLALTLDEFAPADLGEVA